MNKFEEVLVHFTEKQFSKKLTKQQIGKVLQLYKNIDVQLFRNHKPADVVLVLSKLFSNRLKSSRVDNVDGSNTFDLHEYQKNRIESDELTDTSVNRQYDLSSDLDGKTADTDISSNAVDDLVGDLVFDSTIGSNTVTNVSSNVVSDLDLDSLKMYLNPEDMYVHYYLVLDSDYRDTNAETPSAITKFTWVYTPTQNVGVGFCNSVGVISNIVSMRMYQPRIPYLAGMNTDAKRVSVLVEELGAQSFMGENGRRFHFLLRPNFLAGQTDIELSTEDYNDGIFNFNKPIQSFSSLTLSFGDPLNILTFATPFNRFIVPFEFTCLKNKEE